ncbi:MAG: YihA family ribosome biogenesis GTP-binding protein [Agathobacter sp.]|nr:YihA family ribosome biogenesis GTP-binding protein [Agathobacter sp.]
MVIKNVSLETVCGITSTFPDNPHYEVAFAGKSNVGKSSLINALMNRKSLARTSSQPGKTQTINFYNINDAMYLVDLPGYGYANANVEIKAKWGKMIEKYLHTSTKLKAVFLLIDIRHQPSDNDCLMYEWMVEQGFAPIIIATKMDKISRGAVPKHIKMIADTLNVEEDTIMIPFSAETKQGREDIWELIDSLVLPEESIGSEVLDDEKHSVIAGNNLSDAENRQETIDAEPEKQRKPRWKATGKETAKKTKKLQEKKAAKTAKIAKSKKKK